MTRARPTHDASLASRADARGLALVAVLVALGILLGLAIPFLLSMSHGQAAAVLRVDEAQAEIGSASVRDLLLDQVARGHAALDETPGHDTLAEFPGQVTVPDALAAFTERGRQLLAGEAEDLQRRINLNTASPLVLANLTGGVARLASAHEPDVDRLQLDDASGFPDQGIVVVDRELIRYGRRTDTELLDLQRGVRADEGFASSVEHRLAAESLVIDYRCVLAVTYPFWERHESGRRVFVPYQAVSELTRLATTGYGGFTLRELDALEEACTVASISEVGTTFGKPERVFEITPGGMTLQLRSAAFLAGGTVVRVRKLHEPEHAGEYNLVWSVEAPSGGVRGLVNMPRAWYVNLLRPLEGSYEPIDTVIEPLLPQPVNVNTASRTVLVAALQNLRQGRRVRPPDDPKAQANQQAEHGEQTTNMQFGPPILRARAEELVDNLLALGGRTTDGGARDGGGENVGPYTSFEDFEQRFMKPLLADAKGPATQQLIRVYQNALTGRDGNLEMGTVPFCFSSAPVVAFRAGLSRNKIAGQVAARHERQGTAFVLPNEPLDLIAATQEHFEEAFRLDRRAPFYTTHPINVGALLQGDRGTDPAPRHAAHLLADAFPQLGFGQARFPSRDGNGAGFRAAPASTPFSLRFSVHEDMAQSLDPEGRSVDKEGSYEMSNTGPRARGGQPGAGSTDHSKRSFPFTSGDGVADIATSFWFRLKDTGPQGLYDLAAQESVRDRIKLSIQDGFLWFKVFDAAGADPDGQAIETAPDLCAGQWKVLLQGRDGFNILADTWYHVSLSARGNRPGQLLMLVDGVPRGQPAYRTFLTEDLAAFTPDQSGRPFNQDVQRFLPISVEDTESFPPQGVLRIGLELFEYTRKDQKNFYCEWLNSRGGRLARMSAAEFRPQIPVDNNGRPTKNLEDLGGNALQDASPKHQRGAAVELYGYSIPLYRDAIWQPGSARLSEGIGAFAVARMINDRTSVIITLQTPRGPVPTRVGVGLDDVTSEDIYLGNPQLNTPRTNRQPVPAEERILAGFPASGGYALLVQQQRGDANTPGASVGGLEVIRYGRRDGNRLTGVLRAQTFPGLTPDNQLGWDGRARKFVGIWDANMVNGGTPPVPIYQLTQAQTYVVPISLPVTGTVADPSTRGLTEWVQLYDRADEARTEWVRYNYRDAQHVVRVSAQAFRAVHFALTNQRNNFGATGNQTGGVFQDAEVDIVYQPPMQGLLNIGIGSIEQIEYDHPIVFQVRRVLHFRGEWGTSCRTQSANVAVLPVHRAELDWGNYGGLSGRVGRNDRVSLVEGTVSPGGRVEWHTVNWAARRFGGDVPNLAPGTERLGPYPFQLVGLKQAVSGAFIGPGQRDDRRDARLLDRLVKFPSGDLPSAFPDRAVFGASALKDDRNARAVFDELSVLSHRVPSLILDADLAANAQQITVRNDATVASFGVVLRAGVMNELVRTGGMLCIDGELIAYDSFNGPTINIARNGRGRLGTQARAHDEGALVYFVDQIPVAILAGGVANDTYQFVTNGLGGLPRHGGTLLSGTELIHYGWTLGDQLLEMPSYVDQTTESKTKRGLFRGRFGTNPYPAGAGEPLIWYPHRYWDRYRERTDDPELAYFQASWRQGSAWFKELGWQEQNDEQLLVDLQCVVRVDGKPSFLDEPNPKTGLFKFADASVNGRGNRIDRQGDLLEARFYVLYRSGAFDPFNFLVHAWKKAPLVNGVVLGLEGEARILEERVTAR